MGCPPSWIRLEVDFQHSAASGDDTMPQIVTFQHNRPMHCTFVLLINNKFAHFPSRF